MLQLDDRRTRAHPNEPRVGVSVHTRGARRDLMANVQAKRDGDAPWPCRGEQVAHALHRGWLACRRAVLDQERLEPGTPRRPSQAPERAAETLLELLAAARGARVGHAERPDVSARRA